MPKLWRRDDGCLIIKGIIHNEDEDHCTWQVDDARNTITLLNAHGIDTSELPATFPQPLIGKLKRLHWISTENNAGRKRKSAKSKSASKNSKKQSAKKRGSSARNRARRKEIGQLAIDPKMMADLPPKLREALKKLQAQSPKLGGAGSLAHHWHGALFISVAELARQLRVKPIQIMNEAGRRGFKTSAPSDEIPVKVAAWIRDYFRETGRNRTHSPKAQRPILKRASKQVARSSKLGKSILRRARSSKRVAQSQKVGRSSLLGQPKVGGSRSLGRGKTASRRPVMGKNRCFCGKLAMYNSDVCYEHNAK